MRTVPQRIASLLPGATEFLFALGLGDRVVAVSHECDWPPEARRLPRITRTRIDAQMSSAAIDEEVRRLLASGEALYEVDCQLLARLAPDLIVTQAQCDVCAVKLADVENAVAQCGLGSDSPIVALAPTSLVEILADINRIASAAGMGEAGKKLSADLQRRMDAVAAFINDIPMQQRPRVAAIEWIEPIMLAGNWMPELITRAGGRSLVEQWGQASRYAEWQEMIAADPDVILVMPCGLDLARGLQEAKTLQRQRAWDDLKAVRSGRVYAVDGNAWFNRAGPRSVESLEILAHLLHPERVAAPRLAGEIFAILGRLDQSARPQSFR